MHNVSMRRLRGGDTIDLSNLLIIAIIFYTRQINLRVVSHNNDEYVCTHVVSNSYATNMP